MKEDIILVNEQDQAVGQCEKHRAHELGLCHRAFSVFIFRRVDQGLEVLLQKRQATKYHSAGLWTNTCCGHPRPGETIVVAAERRLREEMGFSVSLMEVGVFHYQASLHENMIENEIDHVLMGLYNNEVIDPNEKEVMEFRWADVEALQTNSADYTVWFDQALKIALDCHSAA